MKGHELTPEYLSHQGLSTTIVERFWEKVDKRGPVPKHCPELGPCWKWLGGHDSSGYGMIVGRYLGGGRNFAIRVHVLMWILSEGPIPEGVQICHRCDNPECSRFDHLFAGTQAENMADMKAKGRAKGGTLTFDNPVVKMTRETVLEIRRLYQIPNRSVNDIARHFGICRRHVWMIGSGRSWPDLI